MEEGSQLLAHVLFEAMDQHVLEHMPPDMAFGMDVH